MADHLDGAQHICPLFPDMLPVQYFPAPATACPLRSCRHPGDGVRTVVYESKCGAYRVPSTVHMKDLPADTAGRVGEEEADRVSYGVGIRRVPTGRSLPLAGQEPDGGCTAGNRFANDSNAVAMSTSAQKRW